MMLLLFIRYSGRRLPLIIFPLVLLCTITHGQSYDTIRVGYTTSVNMIFATPILRWDMGLGVRLEGGKEIRDVLIGHSSSNPKHLKLGAGISHFKTTNLFVETERAYYNFILLYDPLPLRLLIKVKPEAATILKEREVPEQDVIKDSRNPGDDPNLAALCTRIYQDDYILSTIGEVSQQMVFFLAGIYISGDHLFFKVVIKNKSAIPFSVGFVGFFSGDRGRSGNRRRPRQEERLSPVFVYNEAITTIKQGGVLERVYVFKKFTLASRKRLYIQFWEGDGGERKVELEVKSKDVLRARVIGQ